MKKILTILAVLTVVLMGCDKETVKDPDKDEKQTPPDKIAVSGLTMNNIATSPLKNVKIYSTDGVLRYNFEMTYQADENDLPTNISAFGSTDFPYSVNEFDLVFYTLNNVFQETEAGRITLKLADYSGDSIPKPAELFFNKNGWAGTLRLAYR